MNETIPTEYLQLVFDAYKNNIPIKKTLINDCVEQDFVFD